MEGYLPIFGPIQIGGGTQITADQIILGDIKLTSSSKIIELSGIQLNGRTNTIKIPNTAAPTQTQTKITNSTIEIYEVKTDTVEANTVKIGRGNAAIDVKTKLLENASNIANNTSTINTHTGSINLLVDNVDEHSQKLNTQSAQIQEIKNKMDNLNFQGGYGIFGRLNDNDDYKDKLVGHIAAVGPLVYGFLYDGKTISEKNDGFEHITIGSIDGLWTNCGFIAPQDDILINWNGGTGGGINSNKIRTFKITHTNQHKIKFEYVKGHQYTTVIEQNKTFFWYTRPDVDAEVPVQTSYDYSFAGDFRVPTTGWITDGISKCQTSYEIDKPAYICTDPSTRNITITGIDYNVEMIQNALDIAGGNLQNDRLYALVDSCSEEQGRIFITFFAASAPSSPININIIISAKGYK